MLTSVQIAHGLSQCEVFAVWEQALARGFRALGVPAEVYRIQGAEAPRPAGSLGVGFNLVRNWTPRGNRHLAWLVDHPVYHAAYFMPAAAGLPLEPAAGLAGCVDRHWTRFARELYGHREIHFLPHACARAPGPAPAAPGRGRAVVFFGSLQDPDTLRTTLRRDAGALWPALEPLIEDYQAAPAPPPLDTFLLERLRAWSADPDQVRILMNAFFPPLDGFFRCRDRLRVLQSLRHTTVHVYGSGHWPSAALPPTIVRHDPVPFARVPALLAEAGVLLNHSPAHCDGSHERVFEALAAGCAVLTTPSGYLAETFGPHTGLEFYGPGDDLDARLAALLADPGRPAAVRAGQELVARDHTFAARAERIRALYHERWPDPAEEPA